MDVKEHPVTREIRNRAEGAVTPDTTLALAIEGGGMRAVISSGMCAALESYGIQPSVFDVIYGCSAGSIIGAYYIAKQIRRGTSVFYEDITDSRFISRRRLFTSQPIMVLDYLIEDVIVNIKPIDWKAVLNEQKLRIIATNSDTGRREVLGPASTKHELQQHMRASANIPMIAGGEYIVDGKPYLDGSLSEAIPWRTAVDDGATHVLVLSTRPLGESKSNSISHRIATRVWMRQYGPEMQLLASGQADTSTTRADKLRRLTERPNENSPHVLTMAPHRSDTRIGRLEQSKASLIEAGISGFRSVAGWLGEPLPTEYCSLQQLDRIISDDD